MRFSSRGLDDGFTYPCTKADVREAFGEGTLKLAWLGGTSVDHFFNRRETRGEITGRVILTLSVSTSLALYEHPAAYLHAYRIPKSDWSDYLHWQIREIMQTNLRPWVDALIAGPETAWLFPEERLVELRNGILYLHTRRSK